RTLLEIYKTSPRRTVAPALDCYALLYLACDAFGRRAVRRRKSFVVAERTSARSDAAVAVGTRKPRIDGQLLHPTAEQPPQITRVAVESSFVTPWIGHSCLGRETRGSEKTVFPAYARPSASTKPGNNVHKCSV